MKYHQKKHDGFGIATITTPTSPIAVLYLSIDIHGSPIKNLAATSLLYTDVIKSGAGNLTREAFTDAQNQLGATISVSIADNVATWTIKCRSEVVTKTLNLFKLILTQPRFEKKEIVRAKGLITNLLHECKEESKAIAQYELRNTFYGLEDRRYTSDEDTHIAELATVGGAQLAALHKAILHGYWAVSATGDTKTIRTIADSITALKQTFPTKTTIGGNHQPKPPQPSLSVRHIPSRQNIDFSIGLPVPITLHHPDFTALTFALAVLGKWGGFAGRLMSTVREQEGLTYGIYARTEGFYGDEQGYWRIMTFFSPSQALTGLTSTYREIQKLYNEGITDSELASFKEILTTSEALLADSTLSQLRDLHAYHQQGFTLAEIATRKQLLAQLTKDEVNTAIKNYLDPALLSISAAGPINKATEQALKTFLKSVS